VIYFDHNATTPLDEQVLEAMLPFYQRFYGNASSLHRLGRLSRGAIETAREQVAALVGTVPIQIAFTSGGTESNNMAISGLAKSLDVGAIAYGATEHPSVLEPVHALSRDGWRVRPIGVDADGLIEPQAFQKLVDPALRFVSLMLANNETGVIQDVAQFACELRNRGVLVHCDAVQAAGKMAIKFDELNVNLMSLSAHKIAGPKGVGALVMDKATQLKPLIHGGGQERGRRGGTENVAAIVGFGKACEMALSRQLDSAQRLLTLREQLEEGLDELGVADVFAREASRLPNTVQFGVPGIDGEMMVMELDRHGVAVSSGSACSSDGGEPSHVLMAMGIESGIAKTAVRVSLGLENTASDIVGFLDAMKRIVPDRGRTRRA